MRGKSGEAGRAPAANTRVAMKIINTIMIRVDLFLKIQKTTTVKR